MENDLPIGYINDIEFERVVNLLRTSGIYSELQITKIKNAIRYNNIVIKEKEEKINAALNTLLCEPEREVLNSAKEIIDNTKDLQTSRTVEIKKSYDAIIELLVELSDVLDKDNTYYNDFAEYLIMSIEDLNDLINAYNSSNYKFLLSLTEKSN